MSIPTPGSPTRDYRGGNSRTLARTLDLLKRPVAILDSRSQIVFVNAQLCEMLQADATALVGKQTSWEIPSDDTPYAAMLSALAPPPAARSGQIATRRLTAPIVFGSQLTSQIFLPLLDDDNVVHMTIVAFGKWEDLQEQIPSPPHAAEIQRSIDQSLISVRSRWQQLDGLHALVGESSAIQLAMQRAQLAVQAPSNVLICGPTSTGKASVSKGIFLGRLKKAGMQTVTGQYFPIDCSVLDANLIDGMLEVFAGRLRPGSAVFAQHVVLEQIDEMPDAAALKVNHWLDGPLSKSTISATSRAAAQELASRSADWQRLIHRIAHVEICIPALCDRREDIAPLASQILAVRCRKAERALLNISPDAMDLLEAFPWPGNLEQLSTAIDDAVQHAVLTTSIQPNHLPVEIRTFAGSAASGQSTFQPIDLDTLLMDIERIVLRRALKLSPRNRAQVARWLNISRPRLLRRLSQLGLDDRQDGHDDDPGSESN